MCRQIFRLSAIMRKSYCEKTSLLFASATAQKRLKINLISRSD